MSIKLSICIPTYNRVRLLRECLDSVVPQLTDEVELVMIDNCSVDDTEKLAAGYVKQNSRLRFIRNERNLGYSGSQIKCFECARGAYTAILCDDDVYLAGEVNNILTVISGKREYAFIALNYYNFVKNSKDPFHSDFAPEQDVEFKRAYDIMNYPSVGHFSGFIFNTRLARKVLSRMLAGTMADVEKHRGIISELAVRVTTRTDLPSYFIGSRKLAARIPAAADYDILKHLCLEYYEFYLQFFQEGLITEKDLSYRMGLVMDRLPKAIIRDWPKLSGQERKIVRDKLTSYFGQNERFMRGSLLLLKAGEYGVVRAFYRFLGSIASLIRKMKLRL